MKIYRTIYLRLDGLDESMGPISIDRVFDIGRGPMDGGDLMGLALALAFSTKNVGAAASSLTTARLGLAVVSSLFGEISG